MDPFTALAIASAGYGLYNSMFGNQPQRPSLPNMNPPSPEPTRELYDYTNWQNDERSRLLAEYYGGTVQNNPMDTRVGAHTGAPFVYDDDPDQEYIPGQEGDWGDKPPGIDFSYFDVEMPTSRTETNFTGVLPAAKYRTAQRGILQDSRKGFAGNTNQYLKDRGFSQGETAVAQRGAVDELKKDYKQRELDINSRAHDIYAQTLAMLTGEVSDAGQQTAALAANLGNANQMFNQSMMNSYNAAMQQYAYNQNAPMDPLAASMGQMLPLLAMMYGGAGSGTGGVPQTYPAGYGVDPSVSGLTYPMYLGGR